MKLDEIRRRLEQVETVLPTGRVEGVRGLAVRVRLAGARIGDAVVIKRSRGKPLLAEIVGFDGGDSIAMPLGAPTGVGADDPVEATGGPLRVLVSSELLGRVLDGLGRPLDGRAPISRGEYRVVDASPPPALGRRPIERVMETGVRVIDGLMTIGEGQRVGLFAGSGVGKSTLLGELARGANADVVVVALVGERGREVGEFLSQNLGQSGMARSVVVVATSDAPSVERLRAAQVATSVAEFFRDQGKRVLLLVDSITRFARAQREVGLAAGEPPARRGYPPSVFSMLPRLLERSGQSAKGSITAIYTVLVEGEDMDEPIADEVRGILDGHVVLRREIAARGHYPAVDALESLSRVMPAVTTDQHRQAARRVRTLLAAYEQKRDLISLGAYAPGSDPLVDQAIAQMPRLNAFLQQDASSISPFDQTIAQLLQFAGSSG